MPKSGIDIVLPWVNGNDREWLASYKLFAGASADGDSRAIRFRDWDLLRYWFRSIEKFMPWVDTIHFVTSGHLPEWLDINHPKLHWVKHLDFIPHQYLPTFNANAIELNVHRIESLSNRFIYFNDDMFVLQHLSPTHFFRKGLPCDSAVMTAKPSSGGIIHIAINDLSVLDVCFDKHTQMKKHVTKWFNLKYGVGLINNLLLLPWCDFSGFVDPHLPQAFLKSTFDTVWNNASGILAKTSKSKFRNNNDVNQWLVRYWQLAEGAFAPRNVAKGSVCLDITDGTIENICASIASQKYKMMCLNDSEHIKDFDKTCLNLQQSFEVILPKKSSFEK